MPQGLVKPSNAVLYAGEPVIQEMEVLTATNMYPGRLVIHDTNEWDIKVAGTGATNVIGVLDVEPNERRATIYGAGDQARVLRGDIVVLLTAPAGTAIAVGDKLQPAADGKVCKTALVVGQPVGYALQALAVATAGTILVKLTI